MSSTPTCLACDRDDPEHRVRRYGSDDVEFCADCWEDPGDDTLDEALLAEHELLTPAVVAELESLFYDATEPLDEEGTHTSALKTVLTESPRATTLRTGQRADLATVAGSNALSPVSWPAGESEEYLYACAWFLPIGNVDVPLYTGVLLAAQTPRDLDSTLRDAVEDLDTTQRAHEEADEI